MSTTKTHILPQYTIQTDIDGAIWTLTVNDDNQTLWTANIDDVEFEAAGFEGDWDVVGYARGDDQIVWFEVNTIDHIHAAPLTKITARIREELAAI